VDQAWQQTFRNRMRDFEIKRATKPGEEAVSINVRVSSGCFHREHSPRAYELIDQRLLKLEDRRSEFAF
jgi:hypothetical protein